MCGGGVRSILLLPLVPRDNRCMYKAGCAFSSRPLARGDWKF